MGKAIIFRQFVRQSQRITDSLSISGGLFLASFFIKGYFVARRRKVDIIHSHWFVRPALSAT
jgi:hypothetical protein